MHIRANGTEALRIWERHQSSPRKPLTARDQELLDAFIVPVFGLPSDPKSADHVQAYVAETLWHIILAEQSSPGRTLRMLDPPSWTPTQAGGDGLAVYRVDNGVLIFRLWEIKKVVGKAHISATIGQACHQLSSRGLKYLAQYTAIGSRLDDPELARLFGDLPSLWLDDDVRSGIGISVATSRRKSPQRACFGGFRTAFPTKAEGHRLEGLVMGIGDFAHFTAIVRACVWSGR
jgi:hypothetical protein